ncbi:MAG: hypothetical protein IJ242_13870 [Clostridia bacterium]|nr:hypothetical protein [Clostridia bacterium]
MVSPIGTKTTTSFDKHLNTTYVYNVTTYLDDTTGSRTYKRHLIGKLDDAGNIVPTRPKKPSGTQKKANVDPDDNIHALYAESTKQLEVLKATEQHNKQNMLTIKKSVEEINKQLAFLSQVMANC